MAPAQERRICLVTSAPISYNPRLVKEADALREAGFDVSVVGPLTDGRRAGLDADIAGRSGWRWRPVDVRPRPVRPFLRWFATGVGVRALRAAPGIEHIAGLRERAYSRYAAALARAAAGECAALYIAHNLPALPAAAWAAARSGGRFGFDAEDYHRGQFTQRERAANARGYALTLAMERTYIPAAAHLTASSEGIGKAYARDLGLDEPTVVLNAFPPEDLVAAVPDAVLARERRASGPSLYWYSQMIGPDRGLSDALQALAELPGAQLHVRGEWAAGYAAAFFAEAARLGVRARVHILDPAPPGQLVRLAAQHDIGLALDPPLSQNRNLCVTNKILVYLLAGLGVAAAATEGQRAIMTKAGPAGFLYASGDARGLAAGLRALCASPARLEEARQAARGAAERHFSWQVEKAKLVGAVERVFGRDRREA